jgi:hypothetical protein
MLHVVSFRSCLQQRVQLFDLRLQLLHDFAASQSKAKPFFS